MFSNFRSCPRHCKLHVVQVWDSLMSLFRILNFCFIGQFAWLHLSDKLLSLLLYETAEMEFISFGLGWAAQSLPHTCAVQGSASNLSRTLIYRIQSSSNPLLSEISSSISSCFGPPKICPLILQASGIVDFLAKFYPPHLVWTGVCFQLKSWERNKKRIPWHFFLPSVACYQVSAWFCLLSSASGSCYIFSRVQLLERYLIQKEIPVKYQKLESHWFT